MEHISRLEKEISDLRSILNEKENELYRLKNEFISNQQTNGVDRYMQTSYITDVNKGISTMGNILPKWAIERYSRQIILDGIGVPGQQKLCAAKVLIVGAGGLGCPAAVYLAGAGVGEIGIVDYDTVDVTNIHRQFLHRERDQNMSKAESAANALRSINSRIKISVYNIQLDSENAVDIASKYDLVLDCTDNVPTRYLLNDLCVLVKLPLISGSALKMEGQLTIYGYRADKNTKEVDSAYAGPCYRCVFARPPPPAAVGSCSASGVAGPAPGVVGALQALEAIKYIVGETHQQLLVERMLLFNGEDMTFKTVRLRPRSPQCEACSDSPSITELADYTVLCKMQAREKDLDLHILPDENRISPKELASILYERNNQSGEQRHLLVDVRSSPEFHMCNIDGAVNWPIDELDENEKALAEAVMGCDQTTFICRRGNDSQIAAKQILDIIGEEYSSKVKDLSGGLHAWSNDVDPDFPVY